MNGHGEITPSSMTLVRFRSCVMRFSSVFIHNADAIHKSWQGKENDESIICMNGIKRLRIYIVAL